MKINDLKRSIERRHFGARIPVETIDIFVKACYITNKPIQYALTEIMTEFAARHIGSEKN